MTITFYYDPISGPARAVLLLLDFVKDTTIERKYINVMAKEQLTPEFLAINPFHTIPALRDDESGLVLYESIAIIQYLCEKLNITGKYGVPTEEKAKWQVFNALHNQPHFIGKVLGQLMLFFYGSLFSDKQLDVEGLRAAVETSKEKFTTFEAILKKNGGFIAGPAPTAADLRPWIDLFQISNLGGEGTLSLLDFSKEFPETQKWLVAIKDDLYAAEQWEAFVKVFGPMAEEKFGGPVFRFANQ